ncbi:SRPBCC domain-containing protein [Microbacterium invictum]|uniref:Activator of Hsp90 ATPase homologue 1/2-like C-terminal domain-containing protein n=1 Tax=Microbacterium invictum TaxID=515415 RepID=A0AA40VMX4_9MICO|nr:MULTISPECIES: SRPBCC domain-containing protein [Microbacterium]MBB4140881.1 hypothetical protein [Microbacterium invictum]
MTPSNLEPATAPIVVTRQVAADPVHAFEVFTERLGDWWDPLLTPDPDTYEGADIEEVEGGEVALRHDGEDIPIGTVREWETGERFAMTFHLALPHSHPTRVAVDFAPAEGGTLVTLTHDGWTAGNARSRGTFTEWPHLLARFAALAESGD